MPYNKPVFRKIAKINQETPTVKSFQFCSEIISEESRPGQFLMVWVPGVDEFPISIASAYNGKIEIAVAKVGNGTGALHEKRVGEYIGIRGPYGNWFNTSGEKIGAIAGGYASPAIRFYAEKNREKDLTVFLGAKTREELLYKDEIKKFARVEVATENGSEGFKGLVTELFSKEIEKEKFDQVITCGPEIMMKKVCEITRKYRVPTQVLTERIVKCAKGFCGSCDLGGYRICKEGPVFDSEKILKTEFGIWTRAKSGKRIPIKSVLSQDFSSLSVERFEPEEDEYLKIELCGIKFPNPFMNSSGFGVSGKLLYRYAAEGGAGAIVTKSVCLEEKEGFDGPNFFEIKKFTPINAMGLPNPGIKNMECEIEDMKKAGVPIILSIFGKTPDEYEKVAEVGVSYSVKMIEINVSCPHTELASIEENPELVKEITKKVARVCHSSGIPVSVKISPNSNYIEVAKAAEEGWANGIVAINTLRYRPMNKKLRVKMLGSPSGFGGISGRGVRELSKKILKELNREIEIPIISTGGIFTWKDALTRFVNGASACQIGSAIGYKGIKVFEEIKKGVKNYLKQKGYENISEVIGACT